MTKIKEYDIVATVSKLLNLIRGNMKKLSMFDLEKFTKDTEKQNEVENYRMSKKLKKMILLGEFLIAAGMEELKAEPTDYDDIDSLKGTYEKVLNLKECLAIVDEALIYELKKDNRMPVSEYYEARANLMKGIEKARKDTAEDIKALLNK